MSAPIIRIPMTGERRPEGLLGDYFTGRGAVARRLGPFDAEALLARARRPARTGGRETWNALVDRIVETSRSGGAAPEVLSRLEEARGGAARFVVTGQQPGALGGPLLTLHKVISCAALAERIEEQTGVATLPLYWVGADDVDFAEVRDVVVPTAALEPVTATIDGNAHDVAMPVGDISVGAVAALWRSVSPILSGAEGHGYTADVVVRALAEGPDHGGVAARIVSALAGGRVALVDGRERALREHTRDTILEYFDREGEVRDVVRAEGEALERDGLHAQLWLGPDSGVFLHRDGRRQKISDASRGAARAHLEKNIGDASPGVVLRNLVQDSAFDPIAVVLGPAEIAYRAQIAPLYETLDVPRPVPWARLSAAFVPASVRGIEGLDAARLAEHPGRALSEFYNAQLDPTVKEARARLLEAFEQARAAYAETVGGVLDGRTADRLKKRLDEVRRRLGQATSIESRGGRARALERWPFLAHLEGLFEREGKPQERFLSMLAPFLVGGERARESLIEAARAHVDGMMDARPHRIVYSI